MIPNRPEALPLKTVVLGAHGFLGSSMVRWLAMSGNQVTAYWRIPRSDLIKWQNVTSVIGDIRDTWILEGAIRDADVVYHFASSTHPSLFYSDPGSEYLESLQPLIWLIDTAARNGVRKIVYPSSGGTIYAKRRRPRTEDSPLDPRSPYAIFKVAAEWLLLHAAHRQQLSVDIYRIGNPYGPGQVPRAGQGVIAHWMQAVREGRPIQVFGDGSAERDYVFIEDACRLMSTSCSRLEESEIFNLGTGTATSLNDLLAIFLSLLGRKYPIERLPQRTSDIDSITLCPDRLLRLVPEFAFTPLPLGLRETLKVL